MSKMYVTLLDFWRRRTYSQYCWITVICYV